MRERGRFDATMRASRARAGELQSRVPKVRSDVLDRLPEIGNELRTRGSGVSQEIARQYAKMDVAWARGTLPRIVRGGILAGVLAPLLYLYLRRRVDGREVLAEEATAPVIFVANHCSHLDTPTILRALPRRWRNRTAVAAAADYFYKSRWRARSVALVFNTVPLGRHGGGMGKGATDHVDRLIGEGWNLLMFPEGTRSRNGKIGTVHSGAAVLAARHGLDIVPIWVGGTHEAMPPGENWPKRLPGRLFSRRVKVEVRFGQPIPPRDPSERHEVMDEVRAWWESRGRPEDDGGAAAAHDVLIMHAVLEAHERKLAEVTAERAASGV
jgi:1-acyl-sn-glycerol-3-phosphate acyltransferase